jgi:hypothetical protein
MADPSFYTYPSPLSGPWAPSSTQPLLPTDLNADGKSLVNPPAEKLSSAYERFVEPLDNGVQGAL